MAALDAKAFLGRGWGFPVEPDRTGHLGMVGYEEDVKQSILIILGTARGERVMRPDFGVGLRALVFEPLSTTTRALVRHRVEEALVAWEPRIDVEEIRVTPDREVPTRLLVDLRYRVRATNTFYNLVYPFYLAEGRP